MTSAGLLSLLALAATAYAWGPFGGGDGDGDPWSGTGNGNQGSAYGDGGDSGDYGFGAASSYGYPGFDISEMTRLRTVHGILASIVFVAFFPVGSICMRVIPGPLSWIIHASIQIASYVLYIAAAGLGLYLVSVARIPPEETSLLNIASENAHPIIGIVLLAVLFFQPILGFMHHSRFKRVGRRTWWSHAHLWVGRTMITLGIINGGLGLRMANASADAKIAYGVVAGIMWLLWLIAAVFGEIRRRRALRPRTTHRVKERVDDPSPPYTPSPQHGERSVSDVVGEGPIEMSSVGSMGRGRAGGSVNRTRSVSPLSPDNIRRGQV
ncbi:hypothetical protein F5B20DRAFT_563606 [Whalleya microplaca]|nr:hypothetical protein F5B20DRAFT_563606 [Whalleya microplaca]